MCAKILIVDDEPSTLRIFGDKFKREGYEVVTATDGKAAIETAVKEKPALVLLDIVLPDMNGFQVCRILKSFEATKKIKVIVFTNKLDAVNAAEARQSGADEFIEKIADSAVLLDTVRKFV